MGAINWILMGVYAVVADGHLLGTYKKTDAHGGWSGSFLFS